MMGAMKTRQKYTIKEEFYHGNFSNRKRIGCCNHVQ